MLKYILIIISGKVYQVLFGVVKFVFIDLPIEFPDSDSQKIFEKFLTKMSKLRRTIEWNIPAQEAIVFYGRA